MFSFFPNTYVIFALYILAAFFYSRFEYWLKLSFDTISTYASNRFRRYSRLNLILFSFFIVAAIILSVIDAIMSVYIIE